MAEIDMDEETEKMFCNAYNAEWDQRTNEEKKAYQPTHHPACSNQNVLDPNGKYFGAEECRCQITHMIQPLPYEEVRLFSAAHPGSGSLWGRIKAFFTRAKINPDNLEVIEIDIADAPP